jgi:hypothetical protein
LGVKLNHLYITSKVIFVFQIIFGKKLNEKYNRKNIFEKYIQQMPNIFKANSKLFILILLKRILGGTITCGFSFSFCGDQLESK